MPLSADPVRPTGSVAGRWERIGAIARGVERWLLPGECLLCRGPVLLADDDALVCGLCRSRWRSVPDPMCNRCGEPLDLEQPCRLCADWPDGLARVRSAVQLEGGARDVVHRLKYEGWWRVTEPMAARMRGLEPLTEGVSLIPIPLARKRERLRGYNQSERLAADPVAPARLEARRGWVRAARAQRTGEVSEQLRSDREAQRLTPLTIAAALDAALDGEAVVLHEAVSSARSTITQLRRGGGRRFFGSGGGSLGWSLGAAFGMRLALGLDTVAIMGDGTYVFGNPTAAFWGARRYGAPFLAVVLNNAGWNAVGRATVQQHPQGVAATTGELCSSFGAPSDLGLVARASGGSAWSVDGLTDLPVALAEALAATRAGTAAVVDVRMTAAAP